MPRHHERAMCCGAGGARMWMEEKIGKRINEERMDEAASTGADTVGVACPYCLVMLDDGARARGDETPVLDIAQVVARSIGPPTTASTRAVAPGLRSCRPPGHDPRPPIPGERRHVQGDPSDRPKTGLDRTDRHRPSGG